MKAETCLHSQMLKENSPESFSVTTAFNSTSWLFRTKSQSEFVAKDESKEIDTEVCENISHFAVGVHGATNHFRRDSRQEESSG